MLPEEMTLQERYDLYMRLAERYSQHRVYWEMMAFNIETRMLGLL